jgi:MGT family glycosyltransferase
MPPRKILLLLFPGHGHINPTLPVLEELHRRGTLVHVAAPVEFGEDLARTGAVVHPYTSVLRDLFRDSLEREPQNWLYQRPLTYAQEAAHVLPQLMNILLAEAPDLLVFDFLCFAGTLAADITGLPFVVLFPTYASNHCFSMPSLLGTIAMDHPCRAQFSALISRIIAPYTPTNFLYTLEDLSRSSPKANISFFLRCFQPRAETFDTTYFFVGPCLRETTAVYPKEKPLVFVSLGTLFNQRPEVFQMCIDSFARVCVHVLVSTGASTCHSGLQRIPPNVLVKPYVDQQEVLRQASAFITHGGMASTQEAIACGVPMLVLPNIYEQRETAKKVVSLGLGLACLNDADLTVSFLQMSVERLLGDQSFRLRVRELQQDAQQAGGWRSAVEVLLSGSVSPLSPSDVS